MFDCHIHSTFSFDSSLNAYEACKKASELGLDGIAFTDHLDYDFPGYDNDDIIDFCKYSQFMDELKQDIKSGLKVLKGIEVGIQPQVIKSSSQIVRNYDFDFVIASLHIIDGMDPYVHPYYDGKTKHQAYSQYLEGILFIIRNFDDFDILGHINYIIRCAQYADNSLKYSEHKDLFDAIFKELISKGKGLEVNTGSFKKRGKKPIPEYDIDLLKRYRQLGGEIICLGSDAHDLEYIGYKFDYFSQMIKSAGFEYLTHFEKRKPIFVPLEI